MAVHDDHVLYVELDSSGLSWSVKHPDDCEVDTLTWREVKALDDEGVPLPICDFWYLEKRHTDHIDGWPLQHGRYAAEINSDGRDWWVTTKRLDAAPLATTESALAPTPKRLHYGGRYLRSLAEFRIAVLLDLLAVHWVYEAQLFQLGELLYLPDFFLPEPHPVLPSFIEVKADKAVLTLVQELGMPRYTDLREPSRYESSHVVVNEALLTDEFRKPFRLAAAVDSDVWVVGRPGMNQPYVVFHPDGTASLSRRCPLYVHDHRRVDEMRRVVAERCNLEDSAPPPLCS